MAKSKSVKLAAPDEDWKAEDDYRTLMRAEEIKCDPKRMEACMKKHKTHKRVIRSLDDLKAAAHDAAMED